MVLCDTTPAHDTCGGTAASRSRGNFIPFCVFSRILSADDRYADKGRGSGGVYTHLGGNDVIA
jgi:hypothetical protein